MKLDDWWDKGAAARRIDRSAGNMGMLVGLILPTLSIILQGPIPNSMLADMSVTLQIWMCACISGGCLVKLHGALSGMRWYFPHTPIPKAYRYGVSGAFPAFVGTSVYGYYILSNTPTFLSAVGGVATPVFGLGVLIQAGFYWLEARRIEANEALLRSHLTEGPL